MESRIWDGEFRGPGLYLGVPMDVYRADPCPAPSLNASVAWTCLQECLAHGKADHPKLTDEEPASPTRAMDIGSAAHALAFGVGAGIALIHAPNWKKKADQAAKKAAWAAGEIPLLPKEYRRAKRMAAIAAPIIQDKLDGSVVAEAMIVSQDDQGFWYRALVDRMRADARVMLDYKTSGMSVAPEEAKRMVYSTKAYFQEGFQRRILDRIDPDGRGRRKFWFLYQGQKPPHSPCLVETSEAGRTIADDQVSAAINLWKPALVTGEFPGYDIGPHVASPPDWMMKRWIDREQSDDTINTQFEMELS